VPGILEEDLKAVHRVSSARDDLGVHHQLMAAFLHTDGQRNAMLLQFEAETV
jgi:hypothetical protein